MAKDYYSHMTLNIVILQNVAVIPAKAGIHDRRLLK